MLEAIKEREDIRKKYKIISQECEATYNEFKILRARDKKMADIARSDFCENKLKEHNNDPKKYWESIFEIMPSKKGRTSRGLINLVDEERGVEIDEGHMANFINEFFVGIGNKLAEIFYNQDGDNVGPQLEVNTEETLDDMRALDQQSREYVYNINVYKASGVTNISSKILKSALTQMIPQLTELYDKCLQQAIFPEVWKMATVVPLFKGGDRENVSNYRPVSMLPLPGKAGKKYSISCAAIC